MVIISAETPQEPHWFCITFCIAEDESGGIGEATNLAAFPKFYFSASGTGAVSGNDFAGEDITQNTSGAGI